MTTRYLIRYRKALHLPVLILGIERKLFFVELMLLLILAMSTRFSALVFYVPLIGIALHSFFLMATKADPLMTDLFFRARRHYPNFHPALSSPDYEPQSRIPSSFPLMGGSKQNMRQVKQSLSKKGGK